MNQEFKPIPRSNIVFPEEDLIGSIIFIKIIHGFLMKI